MCCCKSWGERHTNQHHNPSPEERTKGGTHNSGVGIELLRHAFQWQRYHARLGDRGGLDLSETEKKGSEKEGEGDSELHCGKGKAAGVLVGK